MAITARNVIDRINAISIDKLNTRWPVAELLLWIGDGMREACLRRPAVGSKASVVQLATGTRQTIPTDGWMLLDVARNMGVTGTVPGRAITPVERSDMDRFQPDWHTETKAIEVAHYMLDERDPRAFYVTPPSTGTGRVEVIYSAVPPIPAADTDVLGVDDIYLTALVDYGLYRAYSKDSDFAANSARAVAHYQAFEAALGVNTQNNTQWSPNARQG